MNLVTKEHDVEWRRSVGICLVNDCARRVHTRDLCTRHYAQARRQFGVARSDRTRLAARFWAKVDRRGDRECWPWLASTDGRYGWFTIDGRNVRAHRVALELSGRPIPPGLVVDHLCRNTLCVNPAHLEAVTTATNTRRGAKSYVGVRTTCKHGHDITDPGNVYTAPDGRHACRLCRAANMARFRRRKEDRDGGRL